jgi:hypothetical protein
VWCAEEIGLDAAHQVMRRWADGDQVAAQVERVARQHGADAGKAGLQVDALHMAHIQMDDAGFAGRRAHAFAGDGAGDHVAGSQFEQRMIALHEALAAVVAQDCALAAQGLGEQKARRAGQRKRGGMELIELHVGQLAPASEARAMPSPVATAGLVVSL